MLLTNGRIYTLDAHGTVADTLVVRDGRVAFFGRRSDVNPAPREEVIDLGGAAALPGLVDAHGHLMHLARVRLTLDLRGAESEETAARRVAERAARVPRGLLVDSAQRLLHTVEPRPTDEQFDRAVRECVADCLAAGLTGIHEMGAELYALASYRRLLERGQFPFRNYVAAAGRSASTWAHYREHGPERPGDGRLTIGALKLMADGALGSRGAALHEPY